MREVLFRGKRVDDKDWAYGYYCHIGWTDNEKPYIVPSFASAFYGQEVDPATVGQFTGLRDKNGVRVFEWDIVRWGDMIGRVKYVQNFASFGFVERGDEMDAAVLSQHNKRYMEVVGNIHNNPELIGGREPDAAT